MKCKAKSRLIYFLWTFTSMVIWRIISENHNFNQNYWSFENCQQNTAASSLNKLVNFSIYFSLIPTNVVIMASFHVNYEHIVSLLLIWTCKCGLGTDWICTHEQRPVDPMRRNWRFPFRISLVNHYKFSDSLYLSAVIFSKSLILPSRKTCILHTDHTDYVNAASNN